MRTTRRSPAASTMKTCAPVGRRASGIREFSPSPKRFASPPPWPPAGWTPPRFASPTATPAIARSRPTMTSPCPCTRTSGAAPTLVSTIFPSSSRSVYSSATTFPSSTTAELAPACARAAAARPAARSTVTRRMPRCYRPAPGRSSMTPFHHQPIFELAEDDTPWRALGADGVEALRLDGRDFVRVDPSGLVRLAAAAFDDVSFLLRPGHLAQLRRILDDPEASENDRFVALELLKNANIAAGRVLPSCQDTGTALVIAHKGERVLTFGDDAAATARGIHQTFQERNLRYSQMAPLDMYTEKNTGSNLPAQIEIYSEPGSEYELLFVAKGGGSANKSFLYQETKALL